MSSKPLIMTAVPSADVLRGDGFVVTEFIEGNCRVTKESVGGAAGNLLNMRNWQQNIICCTYAKRPDGRYRHRQALIGLPRKNGKSALGSSMGLYGLAMGDYGSEIYSCAADKEQARIVFNVAKRMVEMDPELSKKIKIYRDMLEYTERGSFYKVLSSEAFTKEGLNPNVVIYDELHAAPDDELYNVMSLAMGARKNPLLIAITTAGVKTDKTGQDSICYRMYQQGVKASTADPGDPDYDETFFMAWWGAPESSDYRDPEVWKAANPGYDDIVDAEDFTSQLKRVHENEFRTKRLNQWVSSAQAWLPQGAWNACWTDREFTPGQRGVVLGFDGSRSRDWTALVAVTVSTEPQVKVLGAWHKPSDAGSEWRVPRAQVMDAIRHACRTEFRGLVREVACDEYIWQDALDELTEEGIPIVAFPQTPTRMIPATQRMYEAVQNHRISHDGNKDLARHFDNCQLKSDARGARVVKDAKDSPRKIDLAVATIMAFDVAARFLAEPIEPHIDGIPVKDISFVWGNSDYEGRVSAGERCVKCANPVTRHPDGTPRLRRIGLQVVCTPPCDGKLHEATSVKVPAEPDATARIVW
jgi:phage terminase large subunit-like protein